MKKVIDILLSWLMPEAIAEQDSSLLSGTQEVKFILMYQTFEIGILAYTTHNKWQFKYSEWFKNQDNLKPLTIFPDKFRDYESSTLPPFFSSRIPSIKQPKVKKILKDKGIDENNLSALLEQFGKSTISNPFILKPSN